MATILYVTAEVLRKVAILSQPFMPGAMSKLLDLLAVAAGTCAILPIWGRGDGAAGRTLPPPAPIFPRYVEAEAAV